MRDLKHAMVTRRLFCAVMSLAAALPLWTAAPAPGAQAADPISNPQPRSNVLAPGTSRIDLSVTSATATTCRYALGADKPYAQMTAFTQSGSTSHRTAVALDPDPKLVNDVFVRCGAQPDYVLKLKYRVRADVTPGYPRIGNLWGWGEWKWGADVPLEQRAKVDLWMGADLWDPANFDAYQTEFRRLRELNPNILMLASMNAVEPYTDQIPESYYLRDVNGNKIAVWKGLNGNPDTYRLNLTKPEVAEFQARFAYERLAQAGFIHDGIFIDNVFMRASWFTEDIYGNPVQVDADENGIADDPAVLDAAWKAGVLREIQIIRELMPDILISGHALDIDEPVIAASFNGISIGFEPANVLEAEQSFNEVFDKYQTWFARARQPHVMMYEGSPTDQFAYGYGYLDVSTDATTGRNVTDSGYAFARDHYPWMRFALGLTLMNDGYYGYEWGDTYHGNYWWYDEYDFDLGQPTGPARVLPVPGFDPGPNLVENPGFESPIASPWQSWIDTGSGYAANISRDTSVYREGSASARIDVTQTGGQAYRIDFNQNNRALQAGVAYELRFWARASAARTLGLGTNKNAPNWDNYGLNRTVQLTTEWQEYSVPFVATASVSDARLQFFAGASTGTVWIDHVRLTRRAPDVMRRDFTNGSVLLNGTDRPQTINLGTGLRRFSGAQAPRVQTILDDTGAFSTTTGTWSTVTLDSGEWKASGPYYHAFGATAHRLTSGTGEARWGVPISATDTYTVSVWYPAAPEASGWTTSAKYDLVVNGTVVASKTLSQRAAGDTWQAIGGAAIPAGADVQLRLTCSGPCVADAVYLTSAGRYNDGAAVTTLTLQPYDAILLRRDLTSLTQRVYLSAIRK
jgi:hypothetical protein